MFIFTVSSGGLDLQGPLFLQEPPHRVEFSNSSGGRVDCTAHGSPSPEVEWIQADGSPIRQVRIIFYLILQFYDLSFNFSEFYLITLRRSN